MTAGRAAARAALVAVLLALAGCGAGAGADEADDGVRLTLTERFGATTLLERDGIPVLDRATAFDVVRRYGDGRLQGVDGRPADTSVFVNGVGIDAGPAAAVVRPGDRVWVDRHAGVAARVPAVVGSFPEPFLNGIGGERLTTRLECDPVTEAACDEVARRLAALGLVPARSRPGTEGGAENLRVLVGRWPALRIDRVALQLERGPDASGVYARIAADGRSIAALDPRGRVARVLRAGAGLVAATSFADQAPTWIVTGTDAAGVAVAARAVDAKALDQTFALGLADDTRVPLPVIDRAG